MLIDVNWSAHVKNEYEHTILCSVYKKVLKEISGGNMVFAVRSGVAGLFDVAYPV